MDRETESYIRRARRFIKRHPDLVSQYEKTLRPLELNPSHRSLRLHKLSGKLDDPYSVSVNMSYQITLELLIREDAIIPVDIGSHDKIY